MVPEMIKPYEPEHLPPEGIDWSRHVGMIGKANAALARYDGILEGLVNPEILISPLITREAVLSSRIEGTQASMEEVLEFEADPGSTVEAKRRSDIVEVINYRRALRLAESRLLIDPLRIAMIKGLHAVLLENVRGRNKAPGEIRQVQNYIGRPGEGIESATFVPPSPDVVPGALLDWEQYLHQEEKDPLVQLAILKAQFELIHPFLDGNGRIGRMLVPLILYNKNLLSRPVFYISSYFEQNREEYYEALLSVSRDLEWNHWIAFFLRAVNDQAQENCRKARDILDLYDRMKTQMPEILHSQYAVAAIDAIFTRQIFSSADFIRISGIPKMSAQRLLKEMSENDIIRVMRKSSGSRPNIYSFDRLLKITDEL